MWLFTLNAHDALAGAHKYSVGIPLVAVAVYLVLFTIYQIRLDFAELQRNMAQADQECDNAVPTSADLTPGPAGTARWVTPGRISARSLKSIATAIQPVSFALKAGGKQRNTTPSPFLTGVRRDLPP